MSALGHVRVVVAVYLSAFAMIAAVGPAQAGAIVSEPELIAGPSAELVGDPDAAMSEDGTGGVVYLRQEEGRAHVFVSSFADGVWGSPRRVDVGQDFNSSWPQIAAGNNGRLLVTWVQDFGPETDRMYSATMDPGDGGFRSPVPVDLEIGKAISTYPDLSMSRGGAAFLVYNVITDTNSGNPPGYLGLDVRLARYQNRLWSSVGTRIDRNATIPMRVPTAAIAPQIGVDVQGQAVVAWLEPDDEFIDRVWARRVFGGQTGIPLRVSPIEFNGKPLRGGVDGFGLDVAGFGQATVAFRQQPGQTGALDGVREMVNGMPDVFTEGGNTFGTAQLADGSALGSVGAPAVAVDPAGVFLNVFSSGAATLAGSGDDFSLFGVERVDQAVSSIEGNPQVDVAESGAGVVAWREQQGNAGFLAIQERRADGIFEPSTLSGPTGGSVGPPAMGGSSLGDAIVAWGQGSGSNRQVVATVVDAPPDPFLVLVPKGWIKREEIPVSWDPSRSAIGELTYSISIDDEPVDDGIVGEQGSLDRRDIENGRHKIQIFAVDSAGQETGSLTAQLMVDRSAPKVKIKRSGKGVSVSVEDGATKTSSGLTKVEISYGDGDKEKPKPKGKAAATARAKHRFKQPGTYRVRVEAKDTAGNSVKKRIKVKVR